MIVGEILMGGGGGVLGQPIANRKPDGVKKFADLLKHALDIILAMNSSATLVRRHGGQRRAIGEGGSQACFEG